MSLSWLFTWWNAVYALPLAFVLVFLAVTSVVSLVMGGLGELTQGAEADHDVDLGHEVEHDLEMDADVELDHDLEVEHDVEHEVHAGQNGVGHTHTGGAYQAAAHYATDPSLLAMALMVLGVGQAPLILLFQVLLLFYGLIGVGLHFALGVTGPGALLWSLPVTLFLSTLGTRLFATAFGKIFRPFETAAVKKDQLSGRTGRVVYDVNEESGTVHVRDMHGTLHRVRARSRHGALETGTEIIVLGYDPQQQVYEVDDAVAFVNRA